MKKVLIISPSRLGDAVLVSGVVKHYLDANKDAHFTIAANDTVRSLWSAMPTNNKRFLRFTKLPFNLHWLLLLVKICSARWHLVIDFRRTWLTSFLMGALVISAPDKRRWLHKVQQFAGMIDPALKDKLPKKLPSPCIWLPQPEDKQSSLDASHSGLVVLAIGASWADKTWSMDNWASLTTRLKASFPRARFIALAGAECSWGADLIKQATSAKTKNRISADDLIDGIDRYNLGEAIEIIRRSSLVISHDTGLMHVAAALEKPVIALFGDTNPREYYPFDANKSNKMFAVVGGKTPQSSDQAPDSFATATVLTNKGARPAAMGATSMRHIKADTVYQLAVKLLKAAKV